MPCRPGATGSTESHDFVVGAQKERRRLMTCSWSPLVVLPLVLAALLWHDRAVALKPPVQPASRQHGQASVETDVGAAWFVRYAELHAAILDGSVDEDERRFLVWSCRPMGTCGGLGNRVVNIVAAFGLAVLTQRAFIIDYPGSSPLELENFVRSDVIDWRMPVWFEHSAFSQGSHALGSDHDGPLGNEAVIDARRAFNRQDNVTAYDQEVLWVLPTTDLYLPDILTNKHLRARICSLGWRTSTDEVYSLLSRLLFAPNGDVAHELETLWQAHASGAYVICVQLRAGIGSDFVVFQPSEYEEAVSDSLAAALSIEQSVPSHTPVLWWLLTDQESLREKFYAAYAALPGADEMFSPTDMRSPPASGVAAKKRRRLFHYPGKALHMDKAVDEGAVLRTFVEWFAVTRADALVLTLESSFALSAWMTSFRGRTRPTHTVIAPRRRISQGLERSRSHLVSYQCGARDVCLACDKGFSMAGVSRFTTVTQADFCAPAKAQVADGTWRGGYDYVRLKAEEKGEGSEKEQWQRDNDADDRFSRMSDAVDAFRLAKTSLNAQASLNGRSHPRQVRGERVCVGDECRRAASSAPRVEMVYPAPFLRQRNEGSLSVMNVSNPIRLQFLTIHASQEDVECATYDVEIHESRRLLFCSRFVREDGSAPLCHYQCDTQFAADVQVETGRGVAGVGDAGEDDDRERKLREWRRLRAGKGAGGETMVPGRSAVVYRHTMPDLGQFGLSFGQRDEGKKVLIVLRIFWRPHTPTDITDLHLHSQEINKTDKGSELRRPVVVEMLAQLVV